MASNELPKTRVIRPNRKTPAAKCNIDTLRQIADKLERDPEADIRTLIPSLYPRKLDALKRTANTPPKHNRHSLPAHDVRSRLDPTKEFTVISALSAELEGLLGSYDDLADAIVELVAGAEVIFQDVVGASVYRINENLAVKITGRRIVPERAALAYLEEHIPTFPAPRQHGLVRLALEHSGASYLLFMTYIPGLSLETAWPQFDDVQKQNISDQLDTLFRELRSLPMPDGAPLGQVDGGGCQDGRRMVRTNTQPIVNVDQFQDFIFSGSRFAASLYAKFLRSLAPARGGCVFTHSDVRPANIIVDTDADGAYKIAGVIDWEASGFYPEYWEAVKCTNNLSPRVSTDWYMYLPASISPSQYRVEWLVDRVWDPLMENS